MSFDAKIPTLNVTSQHMSALPDVGVTVRVWGWTEEFMLENDTVLGNVIDEVAQRWLAGVHPDRIASDLIELFGTAFDDADVAHGTQTGEIEVVLIPHSA